MVTLLAKPPKHLTSCLRNEAVEIQHPTLWVLQSSQCNQQRIFHQRRLWRLCHPLTSGLSNEPLATKVRDKSRIPSLPELSILPPELFSVLI